MECEAQLFNFILIVTTQRTPPDDTSMGIEEIKVFFFKKRYVQSFLSSSFKIFDS